MLKKIVTITMTILAYAATLIVEAQSDKKSTSESLQNKHVASIYSTFLEHKGQSQKSITRILMGYYGYSLSQKLKAFGFVSGVDNSYKTTDTSSKLDARSFGTGMSYKIARGTTLQGTLFLNTKSSKTTYLNSATNNFSINGRGYGGSASIFQVIPISHTTFFGVNGGVTKFYNKNNLESKINHKKYFNSFFIGLSANHKLSEKLWGSVSAQNFFSNRKISISQQKNLQRVGLGGSYQLSKEWNILANYSREIGKKHHGNSITAGLSKSF